jgi:hypothetical protein
MAYGNNRSGKQPRAHFQLAGGTVIKFKHPYLAGQLNSGDSPIDEIDISSCAKLEGRFFEATPAQDSAKQVTLIDGSTVTVSNRLLNGTITIPAIKTTGLVSSGDFIACLHLIKSVGDTVGGFLYKTDFINGKAITRLYYGVTVKSVPDDVSEGNDVAVYNVQLFYAGWLEAVSVSSAQNLKKIWAVGASKGIEGFYTPYAGQNANGTTGTREGVVSADKLGITDTAVNDDSESAEANVESLASTKSAGDGLGDTETNTANVIANINTVIPAGV